MALKIVKIDSSIDNALVKDNVSINTTYEYEFKNLLPDEKRIKKEILTGDVYKIIEYIYDEYDRVTTIYTTQDGITLSKKYRYDDDYMTVSTNDDGIDQLIVHKISSDKIGTAFREEIIAVTGQTEFILQNTYPIGNQSLLVFKNGLLLRDIDYTEENENTVITNISCNSNDILLFILPIASVSNNSNKRIFYINEQAEFICNHALGTKCLHVTVWIDDEESNSCIKQTINENNVKIICNEPITGIVVIS